LMMAMSSSGAKKSPAVKFAVGFRLTSEAGREPACLIRSLLY